MGRASIHIGPAIQVSLSLFQHPPAIFQASWDMLLRYRRLAAPQAPSEPEPMQSQPDTFLGQALQERQPFLAVLDSPTCQPDFCKDKDKMFQVGLLLLCQLIGPPPRRSIAELCFPSHTGSRTCAMIEPMALTLARAPSFLQQA